MTGAPASTTTPPATTAPATTAPATTAPATTAPADRPRTLRDLLPPYRVILHNDDVNSMDHVVHALVASVPELTEARATEIMLEAHGAGQASVTTCPLERAELYRERLESFGLTATIERA